MSNEQRIRIELTSEQAQQIKKASGRDVDTLVFKVEELESRIAPMTLMEACTTGTHIPDVKV